jgi:hypothetical protein
MINLLKGAHSESVSAQSPPDPVGSGASREPGFPRDLIRKGIPHATRSSRGLVK